MNPSIVHDIIDSDYEGKIELTKELVETYNLNRWAAKFNLMTAGYRDQLDPEDVASPEVSFNAVTVAILAEAKARVFSQLADPGETLHVHIGGETRPHTQTFINILARVYAAHQYNVHLRAHLKTTPIWYSSYGVFYKGYQSGDNLTASHSQFFKGGWKPIDNLGKQLVEEEDAIIREVQSIVANRETITLAAWGNNPSILRDFDVSQSYVEYQKSMVPPKATKTIHQSGDKGFRCAICTVGGSMKNTTEQIFHLLDISTGKDGLINYFFDEEDDEYHQIGQINGENYGVDPTKKEIYRNIGAQAKLLNNEASIVFIWDPDGDRFNMVTTASAANAGHYRAQGLEVEVVADNDRCIVYFTPNQIFLMLTASRIESLAQADLLDKFDWFMASSVTTSRALDTLAAKHDLPIVHVKVGFKYWGTFAEWLESRQDATVPVPMDKLALQDKVSIGPQPRLLIMCEESGGAVFGGSALVSNFDGTRKLVGMREKDGFQFGYLTLSLASKLFMEEQSFADYYCDLIDAYAVKHKYFHRHDERLYDETLTGAERSTAIEKAEEKKVRIMDFFKALAKGFENITPAKEIQTLLNSRLAPGTTPLPEPLRLCLIGESVLEGTYIDFGSVWFVIRASGTDAVLRYYLEGESNEMIEAFRDSLVNMEI